MTRLVGTNKEILYKAIVSKIYYQLYILQSFAASYICSNTLVSRCIRCDSITHSFCFHV